MKISEKRLREIVREAVLKEAALDTFSLEELNSISSFAGRLRYCKAQLGIPIGRGSGRVVFMLNDERVLKLALNSKGVAQNEVEGRDDYYKDQWDFFPEVYEKSEDWSWLVCEYVLPAKAKDFKQCLGIDFSTFIAFVAGCWKEAHGYGRHYYYLKVMDYEQVRDMCDKSEYFADLCEYIQGYDIPLGDMQRISSYGLAMRDGKPTIVILDSGLDNYVLNNYYRN